jgi:hypothetical protein
MNLLTKYAPQTKLFLHLREVGAAAVVGVPRQELQRARVRALEARRGPAERHLGAGADPTQPQPARLLAYAMTPRERAETERSGGSTRALRTTQEELTCTRWSRPPAG